MNILIKNRRANIVKKIPNINLIIKSLFKISQRIVTCEPTDDNHASNKSFVAESLFEKERGKRNLPLVMKDRDDDFNINKLTLLGSFTSKTIPLLVEGAIEKNNLEKTIENTIFIFLAALEKCLKLIAGNIVYIH